MTFLPIVDRELRVRARWRSTYWIRGIMALIAIGMAGVTILFSMAGARQAGQELLQWLAWLTFVFCVLDGFRNTTDCLSEEKREGTLGLLFLTDLRGYDVVLGKFAGMSLSSFYGLLAVVPALAVPVLVGGVTGIEFWRTVLALFNALFFSLCAGMFVSSLSRNERRAWTGTVLIVATFVVLVPIAAATPPLPSALRWFSPTTPLLVAFENNNPAALPIFWRSLGLTHAIAWMLLLLASVLLPHTWRESGAEGKRRRRSAGTANLAARRRTAELLAINPIWWLTSRHGGQRRWLWGITVGLCAAALAVWLAGGGDPKVGWWLFGAALASHLALSIWVASEACDSFAEARSSGAMELLLCTPLTVRQILRGQYLALRHLFLGPVVFLLAFEFLILCGQVYLLSLQGVSVPSRIALIMVVGFSMLWFVADLLAVSRVGMWFGAKSTKATQALTRTILFVLILPLVGFWCPPLGPGLMLAKSLIFFTWAQNRLERDFRKVVTQRFEPTRTWWTQRAPPRLRMPH